MFHVEHTHNRFIMISHRQLFLQHVAQTSDAPLALEIASAKGMYIYDTDGKAYMDLIAGISVSNLGHCHPDIVAAVQKQAGEYMHTLVYGEFVLAPQVQLAKLLADHLPANLNSTYFVNSGTEAVEGALKLAKRYTNRQEIISANKSYHGSTQGAMSLISETYYNGPYRPLLPNVKHIEFNDFTHLERITEATACVIIETVKAEIGVLCPREGYLQALRKRCDEVGALLILDEIQVGCGRTGTLFAFEQYGIVPDILLLAKGFGGGMPIGAFIASKEIMSVFMSNPVLGHITTFGGHPVTCAAALANMQVLTMQKEIIDNVQRKADLFRSYLQHPAIKEIRNAGLLMAVEVLDFNFVLATIKACIEKGIITDWFLFNNNSIRIAPPLIISDEEIKQACDILLDIIDSIYKKR